MTKPSMPDEDDVLAAIDRLAFEARHHTANGTPLISWQQLAFALFEKGSPFWTRPKGQPHGLDRSPAVEFMDRIAFDMPRVHKINLGGAAFYCRNPSLNHKT